MYASRRAGLIGTSIAALSLLASGTSFAQERPFAFDARGITTYGPEGVVSVGGEITLERAVDLLIQHVSSRETASHIGSGRELLVQRAGLTADAATQAVELAKQLSSNVDRYDETSHAQFCADTGRYTASQEALAEFWQRYLTEVGEIRTAALDAFRDRLDSANYEKFVAYARRHSAETRIMEPDLRLPAWGDHLPEVVRRLCSVEPASSTPAPLGGAGND